jgi:APA family basic amino acid/polyamine antiporter
VLVVVALLLLLPASAYKITADTLSYALLHVNAPVWLFTLVDIGALVATTSAALAMILTASRALYQMSEDRLLPGLLRKYNPRTDAAVNGVIISAVIAVLVLFAGNVYVIAAISNFGLMFAYVVVGFDVVHVRMRNMQAPFRTPLYPYLPLLSIALLFALFAGMPAEALMIGVVLIMALIGVYYALREIRKKKTIRIKLFD